MRIPRGGLRLGTLGLLAAASLAAAGAPDAAPAPGARVAVSEVFYQGLVDPLTPAALLRLRLFRYRPEGPGIGAPRAAVLLLPCTACGTAWLDTLARDLVSRGGVEVFLMERRGIGLEERGPLEALRRDAPRGARKAIDHYLGTPEAPARWSRPDRSSLNYLALWGSRTMHEDLRAAAREAAALSAAPVVAGGFSGGAVSVLGYAARVFDDGRAGWEDLAGVVLLDGAMVAPEGEAWDAFRKGFAAWNERFKLEDRFWDLRDEQIRAEIAAALALDDPEGLSPLGGAVADPAAFPAGLTNRAMFGWLLDEGPPGERGFLGRLYALRIGDLQPGAAPGLPASWRDGGRDGEPVRIAQAASVARAPGVPWDWYYPTRLIREDNDLWMKRFDDPETGIRGLAGMAVPIFGVTTLSARLQDPNRPGLAHGPLIARIRAQGSLTIDAPELAHTDLLLADASRAKVFEPLHRWILDVAGRRPSRRAVEEAAPPR